VLISSCCFRTAPVKTRSAAEALTKEDTLLVGLGLRGQAIHPHLSRFHVIFVSHFVTHILLYCIFVIFVKKKYLHVVNVWIWLQKSNLTYHKLVSGIPSGSGRGSSVSPSQMMPDTEVSPIMLPMRWSIADSE
jgi:hypothetical protein